MIANSLKVVTRHTIWIPGRQERSHDAPRIAIRIFGDLICISVFVLIRRNERSYDHVNPASRICGRPSDIRGQEVICLVELLYFQGFITERFLSHDECIT